MSSEGSPSPSPSFKVDCELRPGEMPLPPPLPAQKRATAEVDAHDSPSQSLPPLIKIKVSLGSSHHVLQVSPLSSFGELKRILAQETGLDPLDQRLYFRGIEKDDGDLLHDVGVKHLSKLLLMEDASAKERKLQESKKRELISKQCNSVFQVREEVDQLAAKVTALEESSLAGIDFSEKEFLVLEEMLMRLLLKLDGIEAQGEAKEKRKTEVRRVQGLEKALDNLKSRQKNPFANRSNNVAVTAEWETFESGVGSLNAPPPISPSTKPAHDWERFD